MKINFIIGLLFLGQALMGQMTHPDKTELYRDDVVARIDITIDEDDLAYLLNEGLSSDDVYPATFTFENGTVSHRLEEVGFRVRGNTSRRADKKSFKIDINAYDKKQTFYGVKAINLNGQHNDPTVARAKICADMAEWLNIPSMRTNHVRLYINGEYKGLYANVEHIDQLFVEKRFDNYNGNLYKCLYPANLKYLGTNPQAYKLGVSDRRVYELRNNNEVDDYTDLAEFINILNNTPFNELQCELEQVFNVDSYLRAMVFDILTGNWDGPMYNQNNFYLYHNERTGKMEYIPYDLDNTLGIDWLGKDWATRNIYAWKPSRDSRPIYTKIMSVADYRARFNKYMSEAIATFFTSIKLHNYLNDLQSLLRPYVEMDTYYPQDYGFDIDDFNQGYYGSLPYRHTDYGLRSFVDKRSETALQQLKNTPFPTSFYDLEVNRPNVNETFDLSIQVKSDTPLNAVELCYVFKGVEEECSTMVLQSDAHYTVSIPAFNEVGELSYRVKVENNESEVAFYPSCGWKELWVEPRISPLVINEFMAKNDNTIADVKGEFKDWVELYNPSSAPIYLGNKYLSDDENNPSKWRLPHAYLYPGGYGLFWAGNDPYDGSDQTNFKLSASGEFIGLFDKFSSNYAMIDGIAFGEQESDVSLGRIPNGSGPFITLTPTPKGHNEGVSSTEESDLKATLLYPNPATNLIHIHKEIQPISTEVYNNIGMLVMKYDDDTTLNISSLSDGLYYVVIRENSGEKVKARFVRVGG